MKRLVDESTDELTRALLVAGIEHRPPPGNRARVMMALGAGGALGLFSSNAFAWLGTTAGKVTAASVVVGIAGAALVVVPEVRGGGASPARNDGRDRSHELAELRSPESSTGAGSIVSTGSPELAAREPRAPRVAEAAVAATPPPSATASPAGSDGLTGGPSEPTANEASRLREAGQHEALRERVPAQRAAKGRARKSAAVRKKEASRRDESAPAEASSASASAGAGGADTEVAARAALAAQSDLDAEVRMVDDMHQAVRRQDDEALGRFIERYRLMFPNGQLKKEVAEFAARRSAADSRAEGNAPDDEE